MSYWQHVRGYYESRRLKQKREEVISSFQFTDAKNSPDSDDCKK